LHLRKAESVRTSLKKDKSKASENCYVCIFDLEKALPFPELSVSVAYYRTNQRVLNQ
jgi:hypothetical protein